ncbi:MAG: hypothetical protein ACK8QZ_03370 [Anaerolineales bacterium]
MSSFSRRSFVFGSVCVAALTALPGCSEKPNTKIVVFRADYVGPYDAPAEVVSSAAVTMKAPSDGIFIQPGVFNFDPENPAFAQHNVIADRDGVLQMWAWGPGDENEEPYARSLRLIVVGQNPDPYFLIRCIFHGMNYGGRNSGLTVQETLQKCAWEEWSSPAVMLVG